MHFATQGSRYSSRNVHSIIQRSVESEEGVMNDETLPFQKVFVRCVLLFASPDTPGVALEGPCHRLRTLPQHYLRPLHLFAGCAVDWFFQIQKNFEKIQYSLRNCIYAVSECLPFFIYTHVLLLFDELIASQM